MLKALYIVLGCLLMVACTDSIRDEDTITNTAEENAFAEAIYADVVKMVNQAAMNAKGISNSLTTDTTLFGCDQIVVDTTASPRTILIDFRFLGCPGSYGVVRKGRIISEFTGTYPDSNSIVNIQFLNYTFGESVVSGNIILVNRGRNSEGNQVVTFFSQDGAISDDRTSYTWEANKTWELIVGGSTRSVTDDVYALSGTSFGLNRNGNSYDTEVENENLVVFDCFHITNGSQAVNVKNLAPRTIAYGTGNCDRSAVVTINGKEYNVQLPQ